MIPIDALLTRRSTAVKDLAEPAPGAEHLELILRAATRVPDHGKLCPWRIVILRGAGARKLGGVAAEIFARANPQAEEKHLDAERNRFIRAPLCLAVLFTPKESAKAPEWEQILSAGAVCTNILHAAHALGYGAKWLTEWVAYEPAIVEALGGSARDKVAGFVYLGTKTAETEDRERPEPGSIVTCYR
jgi:nitroreductase